MLLSEAWTETALAKYGITSIDSLAATELRLNLRALILRGVAEAMSNNNFGCYFLSCYNESGP
jgi:hypothetical protein